MKKTIRPFVWGNDQELGYACTNRFSYTITENTISIHRYYEWDNGLSLIGSDYFFLNSSDTNSERFRNSGENMFGRWKEGFAYDKWEINEMSELLISGKNPIEKWTMYLH